LIWQKEKEAGYRKKFDDFVNHFNFEYICIELQQWYPMNLNCSRTSDSIDLNISKLKDKLQQGKEIAKRIFRRGVTISLKKLIYWNNSKKERPVQLNEVQENAKENNDVKRIGKLKKWKD
jgi:hypothetical protein